MNLLSAPIKNNWTWNFSYTSSDAELHQISIRLLPDNWLTKTVGRFFTFRVKLDSDVPEGIRYVLGVTSYCRAISDIEIVKLYNYQREKLNNENNTRC